MRNVLRPVRQPGKSSAELVVGRVHEIKRYEPRCFIEHIARMNQRGRHSDPQRMARQLCCRGFANAFVDHGFARARQFWNAVPGLGLRAGCTAGHGCQGCQRKAAQWTFFVIFMAIDIYLRRFVPDRP